MSDKITERPKFYCVNINAYAKVKIIYSTPFPDSNRRELYNFSCADNDFCPILERKGTHINPNYPKCLCYLELKKLGIAK